MTAHRKKLIEHSLPLEAINVASGREKYARHGHPSTLHKWWAQRPLAACRAVLFAQLVDDPSGWPDHFPTEENQARERRRLHDVIANMVEWPKSDDKDQKRFKYAIETARAEIVRSIAREKRQDGPDLTKPKAVLDFLQTEGPPVYDPFCGGGSIPLEAQRLGLRAYGSDLNPVAVLITKALIEFPPKFTELPPVHPDTKDEVRNWEGAQGLAEDVKRYGRWMRDEAERRIGQHYPKATLEDGSETTVIAWLWARTVASPDPAKKGAHVPLVSSFVLSSKKEKEAIVIPVRDTKAQDGWRFTIKTDGITAEELATAKKGTKSKGANFICVLSGTSIEATYIRSEASENRQGARLMALVTAGKSKRIYQQPNELHEAAAMNVEPDWRPETEFFSKALGFRIGNYGMRTWANLFSLRQLMVLATVSSLMEETRERVQADAKKSEAFKDRCDDRTALTEGGLGPSAYADAVATYLAFGIDRAAMAGNSLVRWNSVGEKAQHAFGRQTISMVWDYAEPNPFGGATGSLDTAFEITANGIGFEKFRPSAEVFQVDAAANNYPVQPTLISSDPPYYDNIGYADLSDFFYVWLRKSLREVHSGLFRRLVTQKDEELVATPHRHGGKAEAENHFMNGMGEALTAMKNASTDMPLTIYYAFKQSEVKEGDLLSPGWAAFLQAVINSGLQVDGTWPIRTEMATRQIAAGNNALASSVVLVCRKRADDAPVIARRDFQRELRVAMEAALRDQQESIPLPDRRQAAIGPGIGVFSKYSKVREVDDTEMSVAAALALINSEIDRVLADGTEALDPETRFALEWYAQHGFASSPAGQAISALQGFNLSESAMNRSGMFLAKGGNAKLLSREEMDASWRPATDTQFTAWEMAQHLARILDAEDGGIDAAGRLLAQRPDSGPDVLLIAERLYDMENNRGKAAEALVWNGLQQAWTQILSAADRAAEAGVSAPPEQTEMGV